MNIHQIQCLYQPLEDRILLRIMVTDRSEFRCWLTRRYVKLLWQVMLKLLERDPSTTTLPNENTRRAMIDFQHENMVRTGQFAKPFEEGAVALAVADAKRLAVAPELATMAESGLPGVEASGWTALCAPAGVPQPVISLLHRELVKALNDRVIRDQLVSTGANAGGERPEEFAAFIRAELAKWGKVIKDANISIQ